MPNQCLAGFVQIVTLCAELFEGPPRQATLSGSNIDRSRNYNGPCGWSEMWVIVSALGRLQVAERGRGSSYRRGAGARPPAQLRSIDTLGEDHLPARPPASLA